MIFGQKLEAVFSLRIVHLLGAFTSWRLVGGSYDSSQSCVIFFDVVTFETEFHPKLEFIEVRDGPHELLGEIHG